MNNYMEKDVIKGFSEEEFSLEEFKRLVKEVIDNKIPGFIYGRIIVH